MTTTDADAGPAELDDASRFVLRHWLVFAVIGAIGAVVGWSSTHFAQRVYRAEVLAVAATQEGTSPLKALTGQYSSLAALAGINLDNSGNTTAITIATLKSRVFLEQFIADHKLLPVLFASRWDASRADWRRDGKTVVPTLQDGYGTFNKKVLRVVDDKERELILVRVEWTDPAIAADWANGLVAAVNGVIRGRALETADRSIEYLNKELERTQAVEIRQSIFSSLQSQVNRRMLANTRPDFALTVLDPAQAPQVNGYVSPVPLLWAAIGLFVGLLLALMVLLLLQSRAARRRF